MNFPRLSGFMDRIWDEDIIPILTDYIRIPCKSPDFDKDWDANGHMEQAVTMFADWARAKLQQFPGASLDVVRLKGRTPLILIEIPGQSSGTVLMYGHLDKQPEMVGWDKDHGPWDPLSSTVGSEAWNSRDLKSRPH